jgi:4-alpha-glucanotransferase
MIDDYGIEVVYENARGVLERIPDETVALVREAIDTAAGSDANGSDLSTIVTRPGRSVPLTGSIEVEPGIPGPDELPLTGRVPLDCPLGYHTLHRADGGMTRLIVSPGRCVRPPRMWGWLAQLYALRSASSWGIGDLADLARLRRWAASSGAGFVMINPLLASAPVPEHDPSPYFPVSRQFRNPLYLSVQGLPAQELSVEGTASERPAVDPELTAAGRRLDRTDLIDRPAVWTLKLRALRQVFDAGEPPEAFARWRARRGTALEDFAAWCVLAQLHGTSWAEWPREYRRPDTAGMPAFRQQHAREITYWAWLQWLIEQQLSQGSAEVAALIQDLPIGVDPNGADAWCWQDHLALGMSVGAPPDRFNANGQSWGTPPFVPGALRAAGYQPFIDALRASMLRGGGLRIDHVIGMSRLWWIPDGLPPSQGAYVHYPADDLLDIICLESTRAGAFVIGEDLGTVELPFRDALRERLILSSRVLWFEQKPPAEWSVEAMASVGSHDLPTIQGVWIGSDVGDQRKWSVPADDESAELLRDQLIAAGAPPDGDPAEVALAIYRRLAEAPCLLTGVALDDAVGAERRPNLPGTTERPNWSYPLPVSVDDLPERPLVNGIAEVMRNRVEPRR